MEDAAPRNYRHNPQPQQEDIGLEEEEEEEFLSTIDYQNIALFNEDLRTAQADHELDAVLDTISRQWLGHPMDPQANYMDRIVTRIMDLFNPQRTATLSDDMIQQHAQIWLMTVFVLDQRMEQQHMLPVKGRSFDPHSAEGKRKLGIDRLYETIRASLDLLYRITIVQSIQNPNLRSTLPEEYKNVSMMYSSGPTKNKDDEYLMLANDFLNKCFRKRLAKDHYGYIYEQHFTQDGQGTMFYKRLECRYDQEFPRMFLYNSLENPKKARMCVSFNMDRIWSYIAKVKDPRFPYLKRNRYKFAFQNGFLYIDENMRFVPYDQQQPEDLEEAAINYIDKRFEYELYLQQMHSQCDADQPCKQDGAILSLCPCGDWFLIQTPNWDRPLQYQEFSEDLQRFIWAFCYGRLLTRGGHFDKFQAAPLLIGPPGTGKSTAISQIRKFYGPHDVATLENSADPRFFLEPAVGKLFCCATDINGRCRWDNTTLNKMISCEDVFADLKGRKGFSFVFDMHLIMGANQWPFPDGSRGGQGAERRIVPIPFSKAVDKKDVDQKLSEKMDLENPAAIFKMSLAYQSFVAEDPDKGICDRLPPEIDAAKEAMAMESSSLECFIKSDRIIRKEGAQCEYEDFINSYRMFCKSMNFQPEPLKHSTVKNLMSKHKLIWLDRACSREHPPLSGRHKIAQWVIGIELRVQEESAPSSDFKDDVPLEKQIAPLDKEVALLEKEIALPEIHTQAPMIVSP